MSELLDLPQVSVTRTGDSVTLDLAVRKNLPCFPDHFPRYPMLPGVLQVGWVVRAAREAYGLQGEPRRISQLKFSHPILPDTPLQLQLERQDNEVRFRYRSAAQEYSSGRLLFDDGAADA